MKCRGPKAKYGPSQRDDRTVLSFPQRCPSNSLPPWLLSRLPPGTLFQKPYTSLQGVKQEIAENRYDRRFFILSGENVQLDWGKHFQAGHSIAHRQTLRYAERCPYSDSKPGFHCGPSAGKTRASESFAAMAGLLGSPMQPSGKHMALRIIRALTLRPVRVDVSRSRPLVLFQSIRQ